MRFSYLPSWWNVLIVCLHTHIATTNNKFLKAKKKIWYANYIQMRERRVQKYVIFSFGREMGSYTLTQYAQEKTNGQTLMQKYYNLFSPTTVPKLLMLIIKLWHFKKKLVCRSTCKLRKHRLTHLNTCYTWCLTWHQSLRLKFKNTSNRKNLSCYAQLSP